MEPKTDVVKCKQNCYMNGSREQGPVFTKDQSYIVLERTAEMLILKNNLGQRHHIPKEQGVWEGHHSCEDWFSRFE